MDKWERNIRVVTKTVGKYHQESYVAVVHVIQSEWIFLQHVTKDGGQAFSGVGKVLQEKFFLVFSLGDQKPSLLW